MLGQEDIQTALEALPGAALIGLGAMVVVGLVMWLAGALLVRVACVISGLVIGGTLGWLVGVHFEDQGAYVLPLAIGGAILGGLLAGLLFRLWIAAAGALLLALVVPAVSLVWQGAAPTTKDVDQDQIKERVTESAKEAALGDGGVKNSEKVPTPDDEGAFAQGDHDSASGLSDEPSGEQPSQGSSEAEAEAGAGAGDDQAALVRLWTKVTDLLVSVKDKLGQDARAWWDSLEGADRQIVYLGLFMGAAIGLVLGLVAPWFSAALQSSLIGSCMVYAGTVGLLRRTAGPDLAVVPDSARGVILLVGLITALGAFLQWMAYRKQTDK